MGSLNRMVGNIWMYRALSLATWILIALLESFELLMLQSFGMSVLVFVTLLRYRILNDKLRGRMVVVSFCCMVLYSIAYRWINISMLGSLLPFFLVIGVAGAVGFVFLHAGSLLRTKTKPDMGQRTG